MKGFIGGLLSGGVCALAVSYFYFSNKDTVSTQDEPSTKSISQRGSGSSHRAYNAAEAGKILGSNRELSTEQSLSLALGIQSYGIDELSTLLSEEKYNKTRPISEEDEEILASIFSRLAQIDPVQGVELAKNLKGKNQRLAKEALFKEWTKNNTEAAMEYALNEGALDDKKQYMGVILRELSQTEPERAFQLAEEHNVNRYDLTLNWANSDPVAALKALEQGHPDNNYYQSSVMTVWMRNDPEKALAHFRSLTSSSDKNKVINGVIQGFDGDFERIFKFVETLENPSVKKKALYNTYSKMVRKDPEAVAKLYLENQGESMGGYSASRITERLAETGEENAMDFINELSGKDKQDASNSYLKVLSTKDPMKALELAFSDGFVTDLNYSSHSSLGSAAGRENPEAAIAFLQDKPDSANKQKVISYLLGSWMKDEPEKALESLSQYKGSQYNNAYYSAGREVAENPELGVQWLSTIEDKNNLTNATRSFTSTWINNDQVAASEWLNSLPDGKQRDTGVLTLISNLQSSQPDYAMEWAYSLSSKSYRDSYMRHTYQNWKKSDPIAAAQWLNSSDLVTDKQRASWE